MYEIIIERRAERDIKRLSELDFNRIVPRIRALVKDPRPFGCRKITGSKNDWRIRIGDYRVIYTIYDKTKVVELMKVRHRREAYD